MQTLRIKSGRGMSSRDHMYVLSVRPQSDISDVFAMHLEGIKNARRMQ